MADKLCIGHCLIIFYYNENDFTLVWNINIDRFLTKSGRCAIDELTHNCCAVSHLQDISCRSTESYQNI